MILLSGFLGSGKTTLLTQILDQSKQEGLNVGILINEIGQVDIDGHIIADKHSTSVETILDGCVCCSKKSEIINSFEILLKTKPDVIYVELTGVAEPHEVIMEMEKKEIIAKIYLNKVVTVVDALNLNSNMNHPVLRHTCEKQLSIADLVIVNKMDLIDSSLVEELRRMINKMNPSAELTFTSYSQIKLEQLFLANSFSQEKKSTFGRIEDDPTGLSFNYLSTVAVPIPFPVSKRFIENYLESLKPNLVRAKGFVLLEEGEIYLVQLAGNQISWELFQNGENHHSIVLIGVDLVSTEAIEKLANQAGLMVEELLMKAN